MNTNKTLGQVCRFFIVGGLNTLFGFLAYSGLILLHSPTWIALVGSTVVGIAFNFFTTGTFVFQDQSLSNLPKFVLAYLVIFLVNLNLIDWLANMVGGSIKAQGILLVPMALFAYFLLKKFVYNSK